MEKFYTLIFIRDGAKLLLGMKKRGFGKGKWNGFGGKIEKGETKFEAAIRELKEESGLEVLYADLKYLGYVSFTSGGEKRVVYIFFVEKFKGCPKETEEMRPEWFNIGKLPYGEMWMDCKEWLPLVLKQKYFVADFIYEENLNTILQRRVRIFKKCIEYPLLTKR